MSEPRNMTVAEAMKIIDAATVQVVELTAERGELYRAISKLSAAFGNPCVEHESIPMGVVEYVIARHNEAKPLRAADLTDAQIDAALNAFKLVVRNRLFSKNPGNCERSAIRAAFAAVLP